jgi:hypothetical protein
VLPASRPCRLRLWELFGFALLAAADSLQRPSRTYQSATRAQNAGVSAADAASKASRLTFCFAKSSGVTSIRPLSAPSFIASRMISIALNSSSDRPSMGCVSCAVSNRRRRLSSRPSPPIPLLVQTLFKTIQALGQDVDLKALGHAVDHVRDGARLLRREFALRDRFSDRRRRRYRVRFSLSLTLASYCPRDKYQSTNCSKSRRLAVGCACSLRSQRARRSTGATCQTK